MSVDTEVGYALSPKGYQLVMDVEAAFMAGVDIEDIADHYGIDVEAIQVLMVMATLAEQQ